MKRRAAVEPPVTGSSDGWRGPWLLATVIGAVLATIGDGLLLERRRGYFTGGFLAANHLVSPLDVLTFVVASLACDAAVIGVVAAIVLWIGGRRRLTCTMTVASAVVVALIPILGVDFVQYQLLSYLGDAVDLRLMFELSGRSPREFLAVSWAHILNVAPIAALGGAVIATVTWGVRGATRRALHAGAATARVPLLRALRWALLVCAGVAVASTVVRTRSSVMDNGLRRKPTAQLLGAIVDTLTDFDGDGYGALSRPGDGNLFDARIHPYALDVPGNGIDEDGVAGDLPVSAASPEPLPIDTAWQRTPDVVLVVLESFRADAVGAHLDGKPVTPVLDALAASGVAASSAYSHNGYTVQSRRHIFAGTLAARTATTLLDDFGHHGYETAYFSAQDEAFGGADNGVGFDRADVRFDARADPKERYSTFTTAGSLAVPFTVLERRVDQFLDHRPATRPLFLYLNFHDTHFPYHHAHIQPLVSPVIVPQSSIAPSHQAALRRMYLNTAANVDAAIGRVLDRAAASLGHRPAVIVLSDHGESLFDEDFLGHGYALNDAQTRIPLIVTGLPAVVTEPFGQADLRGIVNTALATARGASAQPSRREDRSRRVFQYLGTIERPAEIGFVTVAGRTIYDFRSDRVFVQGKGWRRPSALDAADDAVFRDLLHVWERLMLARAAAGTH